MPQPNGYEKAERLVVDLSQKIPESVYKRWPDGASTEQLRNQLAPIRPILQEVRATFQMGWWTRPELSNNAPPIKSSEFRSCAWAFATESVVSRSQGDYVAAMQRSLDAMELGCKLARGAWLYPRIVAKTCHAIGFAQAEQTALLLSGGQIPAVLTRVRRVRDSWPPLRTTLDIERIQTMANYSDYFRTGDVRPPCELEDGLGPALRLLIQPRRAVLATVDHYLSDEQRELVKPVRERVPVRMPEDAWSRTILLYHDVISDPWRTEKLGTQFALLEVALAVRMYYLEHGRFPTRLSDISKKWLPAIPVDLWDQPITYRLKSGQPVIYSLGPDGKDDGGQPTDPIDLTPSSRGDLVFGKLSHRLRSPRAQGNRMPHH
jgi:hypothetical protein